MGGKRGRQKTRFEVRREEGGNPGAESEEKERDGDGGQGVGANIIPRDDDLVPMKEGSPDRSREK